MEAIGADVDDGDKPMVYLDDEGRTIFRASALGQCTTAMIALRMGFSAMKPPKSMQDRFNEGHLHEPDIVKRANTEFGVEVFGSQRTVTWWVTDTIGIKGHIDGEAVGWTVEEIEAAAESDEAFDLFDKPHRLFEAKTMSEQAFRWWVEHDWDARWKKYPGYARQFTVYGHATELEQGLYAVKNKESGQVIVEPTPTQIVPLPLIKATVVGVEAHVRQGLPMPDECKPRKSWPCPVFYVGPCGDDNRDQLEERESEVVTELMVSYQKAKEAETAAKEAKKKARDEIVKHLPEDGGKFDGNDGWKVALTPRKLKGTESVFDEDAFKSAHPDLHDQFKIKQVEKWSNETLRVTPPKEGK